jgi:membrane associated rhomboid family serine protease
MNAWTDSYAPRPLLTKWVKVLLAATTAVFVLQMLSAWVLGPLFTEWFALSLPGMMLGRVWQLFTYLFLHGGVLHLLVNMLAIFFIGPELERTMGPRRFLLLYFGSGVLGGLFWLAIVYPSGAPCVGASGSVFGLLGAFAALFPHRSITLLVFFVLPVTMRAWVMVAILALIQVLYLVTPGGDNVAYAAHLGGVIVGFLYAMAAFRPGELATWLRTRLRRPPRLTVMPKNNTPARADIDRILDKIAREGMQSLSTSERTALEKASRERR